MNMKQTPQPGVTVWFKSYWLSADSSNWGTKLDLTPSSVMKGTQLWFYHFLVPLIGESELENKSAKARGREMWEKWKNESER